MEEQTGSPGANTDNSSQRNGEEVKYFTLKYKCTPINLSTADFSTWTDQLNTTYTFSCGRNALFICWLMAHYFDTAAKGQHYESNPIIAYVRKVVF